MEVGTVCLSLEKYESLIQYKRDADKVFISHGGYEFVDAKTKDEAIKYISKIADDSALKAEKTKSNPLLSLQLLSTLSAIILPD